MKRLEAWKKRLEEIESEGRILLVAMPLAWKLAKKRRVVQEKMERELKILEEKEAGLNG